MRRLREDHLHVIALDEVQKSPDVPRRLLQVDELTALGRECLERARLEGERRFCGSSS